MKEKKNKNLDLKRRATYLLSILSLDLKHEEKGRKNTSVTKNDYPSIIKPSSCSSHTPYHISHVHTITHLHSMNRLLPTSHYKKSINLHNSRVQSLTTIFLTQYVKLTKFSFFIWNHPFARTIKHHPYSTTTRFKITMKQLLQRR